MSDDPQDPLSRRIAYLTRKLERSEWQRERLEQEQQNNEHMLAGTIDELREARAALRERGDELQRINHALEAARNEAIVASKAKT